MKNWEIIESSYPIADPWIRVRRDKCLVPNGKLIEAYHILEYPDWVNAVALTDDGQVILVRQYRHGVQREVVELVAGTVDDGEDPDVCVARELTEETGYVFDTIERLCEISPNPANHTNTTYCYLATGGKKVAEQDLDDSEELDVLVVSMQEFLHLLETNQFAQALHVTGIYYALRKLGILKL
ncbi:MAG: NUDIX hydrolase [Spirosomataceae bacterium]